MLIRAFVSKRLYFSQAAVSKAASLQKARGATFGRSGREEACLSERVLKRLLN
jgi:hypothetical protein